MIEPNDEFWLKKAIAMASDNVRSRRGGPFGAVVVLGGEAIGHGTNMVTALNDPTAHAEILAIREACAKIGSFRLEGAVLFSSCEPCPMCLGAVYWARPERVVYAGTRLHAAEAGFDDHYMYEQFAADPDDRAIPLLNLTIPDADEPFRLWLADENRHRY